MRFVALVSLTWSMLVLEFSPVVRADDLARAASTFRQPQQAVTPVSDTTIIAEAEEFHVVSPGWQAKPWGANYFCATFANAFLSRKAFLGAPEQGKRTVAVIEVEVPKAGRYLALIRYECCYRFETQFRLQVEQNGQKKLDRLYGARDNVKIWAFRQKLKKEVAWDWGAGENMVWEGHDAYVELAAGKAKLSLIADKQPDPGAQRNVDLVMLTSDEEQVKQRIEKENYLPLDGMLTQAGDVHLKLHNRGAAPLTLTVPNGIEHSPYWVHIRHWKPQKIKAEPGQTTDWLEVGSLLDTLNDGQWTLTPNAKGAMQFDLEFGVRDAAGKIATIRTFKDLMGPVTLAYDADTRYSRRIRLQEEVLYELVDYLKKHPVQGTPPRRMLIYGYTFEPKPDNPRYTAALDEFIKLIGATALGRNNVEDLTSTGLIRGYIDVRSVPTPKLEDYCQKLKAAGRADKIAVVSLGDEIGLARPPAKDHKGFRDWLQSKGIKPSEVDAGASSYEQVEYGPTEENAKRKPGVYYYSKVYGYRYGIKQLKERTDILRKYLPNAGIGANFSPHHGSMYLGETHHWISLFREDGMTMPWGEDYVFQVPVGTQQMNSIMLDMFRAGIRHKPEAKIHYYVMPHAPNNTPNSWRRQFYGDLAHGAKILNLFEFRPVQAAYTENHVSSPAMYQEVRKSIHELGKFEDIILDGQVLPAKVGIWCSETADVWHNRRPPFDAHLRCLYIAIRNLQQPVDFVVEGDDLQSYKVLYLTDANVSKAGSKAIADWVKGGGKLITTAGAGMFDEFNQPNKILREVLGVEQERLEEAKEPPVRFEKQDLPFAKQMETVTWGIGHTGGLSLPVFCAVSRIKATSAKVLGTFKDKSPALTVKEFGQGTAIQMSFLPGLTYFRPAFPLRPMDRGATDDHMTHFLPTKFDHTLIGQGPAGQPPVFCPKDSSVEISIIQAKQGVVIPLINWNPQPIKGLTVTINLKVPTTKVSLASGNPVRHERKDGGLIFTLDLDVADALILRP